MQTNADGSGTFPLPQQPAGTLFTDFPDQLLADLKVKQSLSTLQRETVQTGVSGETTLKKGAAPPDSTPVSAVDCSISFTVSNPVKGEGSPVTGSFRVPVTPIGAFLTADPTAEGPLPAVARYLARSQATAMKSAPLLHLNPDDQNSTKTSASAATAEEIVTSPASLQPILVADPSAQADLHSPTAERLQGAVSSSNYSELEAVSDPGPESGAMPQAESPATDCWAPYWVPESELALRGPVMDIVTVRINSTTLHSCHYSLFSLHPYGTECVGSDSQCSWIHSHGFVCLFVTSNAWSLNRYSRILDVLRAVIGMQAKHTRSNCFTKTYSRYSKVHLFI